MIRSLGATRQSPLRFGAAATAVLIGAAIAKFAYADTLAEAIALAYQTNPNIQSQRAQLAGVDETYVQARAGWGPAIQAQLSADYTGSKLGKSDLQSQRLSNPGVSAISEQNTGSGQIIIDQPIYTGGKTTADVRAAQARILAGREALRGTEGDVILAVVQAYCDIERDEKSLGVRRANLQVLEDQLKETEARRQAGEVTLTDVAQAQAQLAAERALLASAQGQLEISRTEYTTVVGVNPGALVPAPDLPGLPDRVEIAFETADSVNPELRRAQLNEEVSRAQVVSARSAFRPTVSFRSTFGYSGVLEPADRRNYDGALSGQAFFSQPLFTSGMSSSQIRQALDQNNADRIGIETTRRTMVQNIANAWNQMQTATASITAQQAQVKSAQLAFAGMRVEYRAGERSTLDVLVAEETLRDAELALISAQHDEYLGAASVLRAMGRLEVRALMTGVEQYDAAKHFREIQRLGALPWEDIVARLDGFAEPDVGQEPIAEPTAGANPEIISTSAEASRDRLLATRVPITPVPGTTSPVTPSGLLGSATRVQGFQEHRRPTLP